MVSIQVFLLTAISFATGVAVGINLMTVSWYLLVLSAIGGSIVGVLLARISRTDSLRALSDIGSGSGRKAR